MPAKHPITIVASVQSLPRTAAVRIGAGTLPLIKITMKPLRLLLIPVLLCAFPLTALADDDDDHRGRGRKHGHGEYQDEYWDGNCKVERKFKKNGDYKEKRKCRGPQHVYSEPMAVHVPAPQPLIVEPGITVHGTIRIPH
jgi:hypothetical protein